MLVLVNDMYCYIHVMIDIVHGKMMIKVGFSAEICKISVCCSPFSSMRILVSDWHGAFHQQLKLNFLFLSFLSGNRVITYLITKVLGFKSVLICKNVV